jgi:hypothetical protein
MTDRCSSLSGCKGGEYCEKCSHSHYSGEVFVNGIRWNFEFNPRFGPLFVNLDGEPKKVQPGENHKVWDEFGKWLDNKFNR